MPEQSQGWNGVHRDAAAVVLVRRLMFVGDAPSIYNKGSHSRSIRENFLVSLLVEADQQGVPFTNGRSPQITGRSQHELAERLSVEFFLLQVDMNNFRSFENVQFIDLRGQFYCFIQSKLGLFCIDQLVGGYIFMLKKLLSSGARRSTRTVINPIKRHSSTSF